MSAIPQMSESESKFFESGGQEVAESLREPAPAAEPPEGRAAGEIESREEQETKTYAVPAEVAPSRAEGRFVPLQALQEERAEKKQLREELRQYREWQNQLAQRLRQMPASQAPQAPDPQTRPLDYINHVLGNMQNTTAELQQWRQQQEALAQQRGALQQAAEWAQSQEREFSKGQPEYHDAYRYAADARDKELQALGYTDPATRSNIVRMNTAEIINNAVQQGKNPAELVWEYARARGFTSKGGAKGGNAEAQAKIAAGLQAAGGKLNQGGTTGEGELQAKDLAGISDPEEFEKAWKKVFGRKR
ncbi:MAG TPA: hypothetical protein VGH91_13690 [Gammaproteobacteria bacterium]